MDLKQLLNGVSVRAPWLAAGRLILKGAGFKTHRGYEETINEALKEAADPTRQARLEQLLTEHVVAGEKLVRFVKLEDGEREKVVEWFASKRKTQNVLTDAFPAVASDANVRSMANESPSSVGAHQLEDGRAAIFSSVRTYLDRVPVSRDELRAGVADGYEEIYAMKRVFLQTYDAIWLPAGQDLLCLAADLPLGTPSGFAKDSQTAMDAQVRRLLGRPAVAMNFWPAVSALYRSGEGRLVDYGFVNNTDAVKHHTGRRGGKSLRDDLYDQAGAAAVGDDLLLFKIAIAWSRGEEYSVKAQPELLLPGRSALLHMPNAKLEHAIIRNCLNTRDLKFVVSRLLHHLR